MNYKINVYNINSHVLKRGVIVIIRFDSYFNFLFTWIMIYHMM